jgi:hypothetical protein
MREGKPRRTVPPSLPTTHRSRLAHRARVLTSSLSSCLPRIPCYIPRMRRKNKKHKNIGRSNLDSKALLVEGQRAAHNTTTHAGKHRRHATRVLTQQLLASTRKRTFRTPRSSPGLIYPQRSSAPHTKAVDSGRARLRQPWTKAHPTRLPL